MISILYVEDEAGLAMILSDTLRSHGFAVTHCDNGGEAFSTFQEQKYDLLLIDVMMPVMDGFELAKKVRGMDTDVPIIFLTARTQTEDVVAGFHLGANDYIKKPFKIEELIVRIEALFKYYNRAQSVPKLQIGNYILDHVKHLLTFEDMEEKLSFRESELLRRLFENKDRVVPREEIIKAYWSQDKYFTGRSLDVFISRMRKYLIKDERIKIINIRGIGYMLTIDE
ncbi:response regulator transcription factor [Sphingobacterium spiritivorum]|uniref:Response regulator receiver domain protein n=1 Tax=Sphingobacterium spiritivorum ATCC 33861 TaxID=525373 RepID=D7VLH8_SPHSI|nr:response regulator transcription factor [Sphingobacterium spiritivorum]EFK58451.1 response regulator receiver domain protein [Sphingobacterium spiritivorum ATCC 33861]QQT37191.1 response regulator transcription factor [Sphingobacterium spiritivorum]WQD33971.1 response regulator transcription factor [Sphingobacterium spiritivorum]SUJ29086.1 Sensory transduction protein regX3 [Sphingobacterium spiritivorum]